MTGLEKILKAIETEASANAQDIIAQAKQEAGDILEAAKKEADKKCAEIAAKSEMDVKAVLSRAESSAVLQEKKLILEEKQQIINDIITEARQSLATLSDKEYLDVLLRMVSKYAHNNHGIIFFSEVDKNRLPNNFNEMLSNVLSDKKGASLIVSDETVKFDGGFILKYGDIEENCSFDALFAAAREDLQDKVNTLLFE